MHLSRYLSQKVVALAKKDGIGDLALLTSDTDPDFFSATDAMCRKLSDRESEVCFLITTHKPFTACAYNTTEPPAIIIGKDFFDALTPLEKLTLAAHELGHLAPDRADIYGVKRGIDARYNTWWHELGELAVDDLSGGTPSLHSKEREPHKSVAHEIVRAARRQIGEDSSRLLRITHAVVKAGRMRMEKDADSFVIPLIYDGKNGYAPEQICDAFIHMRAKAKGIEVCGDPNMFRNTKMSIYEFFAWADSKWPRNYHPPDVTRGRSVEQQAQRTSNRSEKGR